MALIDLTGTRYGKLTVIGYEGAKRWLCKCDCGNTISVLAWNLKTGNCKGCKNCKYRGEDLAGKRFGRLVVVSYSLHNGWLCNCDCGNITYAKPYALLTKRKSIKSCGCYSLELLKTHRVKNNAKRFKDIIGERFGRLIAKQYENKKWLCECDCGNVTHVTRGKLISGHTKSCGCLNKETRIINSTSRTERLLGDYIEREYGIKVDRSFSVEDRVYDIRYKNILIESDGSYWHSLPDVIANDTYKTEIAKRNNYVLLRFSLDSEKDVVSKWHTSIKPILDKHLQH